MFCLHMYEGVFELRPRIVVDVGVHIGTFMVLAASTLSTTMTTLT